MSRGETPVEVLRIWNELKHLLHSLLSQLQLFSVRYKAISLPKNTMVGPCFGVILPYG